MIFAFTNDREDKSYEDAVEVLFEENYKKVYKKAISILADAKWAEDATQETFYRAFMKINTLNDKSKFTAWILSIAENVCYRMLTQKINYGNNSSIYDDEGKIKENVHELMDFNIPDNIYESTEVRQELKQCISELDIESQQILNMRLYAELSIEEIAGCMDMKEGTVKSRIHRAKQKVADKLRKFVEMKR